MNLGQNIYRLRTEKNLSQGDLADALDVSRQSVSKWENNSAVPELDKLMKMASIFGITLDELVGNTAEQTQNPWNKPASAPSFAKLSEDIPETSGTVPGFIFLFIAAALGILLTLKANFLTGILYTAPLFICSALCFIFKRRRMLWCCWVILFSAVTWCFHGTGLGLTPFWQTFNLMLQAPSGLYNALTALAINGAAGAVGFWTYHSYISSAVRWVATRKPRILTGWLLTFIPYILQSYFHSLGARTQITGILVHTRPYFRISYGMSWLHLAAVLVMLIFTVARFRQLQMHSAGE